MVFLVNNVIEGIYYAPFPCSVSARYDTTEVSEWIIVKISHWDMNF
jgi:hypothetical protein